MTEKNDPKKDEATIGNVVIVGDQIHAGIDEDDDCLIDNAIVVQFKDNETLAEAIKSKLVILTLSM